MNIEPKHIKINPNIKIIKRNGGNVVIVNLLSKNKVTFEGEDVIHLLEHYKTPRLHDFEAPNGLEDDIINCFLEWGILVIDLKLEHKNCVICKSINMKRVLLLWDCKYSIEFEYKMCNDCGLVFLNPAPTESTLDYFYSNYGVYSRVNACKKMWYEKSLITKSNQIRENVIINHKSLSNKSKILDVGFGDGEFIYYMNNKHGCYVTGIEKDPKAIENSCLKNKKIKLINADFKDCNMLNGEQYDVITLWGFLEHDIDPLKSISRAHDLLKSDGILVIEMPNIESSLFNNIKNCPYLNPPLHLTFIKKRLMTTILKNTKFEGIKVYDKKTGYFLLKYSELVLYLLRKYQITYKLLSAV